MTEAQVRLAIAMKAPLQVRSVDGGWVDMHKRDPLKIDPRYIRIKPKAGTEIQQAINHIGIKDNVISMLISVARAAHNLADGVCEDRGMLSIDPGDFIKLSNALDALDELPEPEQNIYGTGPAKAESLLKP